MLKYSITQFERILKIMKRILVLHTGGTISMHADKAGRVVPDSDNPINHASVKLDDIQINAIDFLNIPSPQITVEHMLLLTQKIRETAGLYDGVVITHGTDTLEETSYFLDTMILPQIPIVLTGAMRSSNELGSDGVYNYLSALRVASHDNAADKGVLVVMNDEIHAAKYVTKTHTTNVSTFQTPTHGPLGIIMKHDILFFKTAEPRVRFRLESLTGTVPIIKAYAGMGDWLLNILDKSSIDGLVVEALGAGNLPPRLLKALPSSFKKEFLSLSSLDVLTGLQSLSTLTKVAVSNCKKQVSCLLGNSMPLRPDSNFSLLSTLASRGKN